MKRLFLAAAVTVTALLASALPAGATDCGCGDVGIAYAHANNSGVRIICNDGTLINILYA